MLGGLDEQRPDANGGGGDEDHVVTDDLGDVEDGHRRAARAHHGHGVGEVDGVGEPMQRVRVGPWIEADPRRGTCNFYPSEEFGRHTMPTTVSARQCLSSRAG